MHGKILLKHFVLVGKKWPELCLMISVSNFYKVLLKQMYFSQYLNICMEKFYQYKVFMSNFHEVLPKQTCFGQYFNLHMEKFYQNKAFLSNFHKVLLKQMCFSQYLNK